MPIYEYRCSTCGFQKEFLQRLNEAPHTKCPECGKRTLKKLVSAAGFQLKGTGWYATDFKNSGKKPAAKDKAAEPAKEGSTKETSGKDAAATKETSSKDSGRSESKPSAGASPASN
jgi:putative FmdB family regulatory protein